MKHYQKIILTHANLKRPIHLVAGTIAGWHDVPTLGHRHVYTTAGIFPATETMEQIDSIIESLNSPSGQGAQDGK